MPKEKDGYKMHMIVPKPTDLEKLKKREELSNRLKEYPNEELKKALEGIQSKKEQEEKEKREQEEREKVLYGDKEKILKNLKENPKYVKIEENVNYMGYKGKIIRITLPGVGKEYEPFEYFVSNESVLKKDFESNPELEKKSYSMKDVGELLGAMNKYMKAMGVETDGGMDYKNDLKYWKTNNYRCEAGDCLKEIAGLDYWYWLKDKNVDGKRDSRARWDCNDDYCYFYRFVTDYDNAKLFLRLS